MKAIAATMPRRSDLDWLRVLAILTVFAYHSTRFFDLNDWSVKNATTYGWVSLIQRFLEMWMMPFIFVISGASLYYAMSKGGPGRFLRDKALRLLVPVVVAAFTHASLQVYLERLSHGQFHGSFFEFLPRYFDGLYFEGGSGNFAFHGMHLWYLLVLFLYCLVLMPLFFWFRSALGTRVLARLADLLALPGAVVLVALPTIVLQNLQGHRSVFGLNLGGWPMEHYLWFLLSGFLIISHERVQQRLEQLRWPALLVGIAVVAQSLASRGRPDLHPDLVSWCVILAILGFGMRHLRSRAPFLDYANEAVMPFYILHQTVLLCVGFFVVQWAVPDLVKYLIIAPISFATILLLYEPLVRRNNWLRLLFGMHPLHRTAERTHPLPSTAVTQRVGLQER